MSAMNNNEIKEFFNFERKKHFDFFLPYYRERNWQVIKDNIDGNSPISWDVKLEIFAGEYVLVDEKARIGEFNDCLIELIQDLETGKLGWYFGRKDWVLYGSWKNLNDKIPSSLYLIEMRKLHNYIESLNGFIKTLISKKGWGDTWNIVISWEELQKRNIAKII